MSKSKNAKTIKGMKLIDENLVINALRSISTDILHRDMMENKEVG